MSDRFFEAEPPAEWVGSFVSSETVYESGPIKISRRSVKELRPKRRRRRLKIRRKKRSKK